MHKESVEQTYTESLYEIPPPKGIVVISKDWTELTREEKTQFAKISEAIRQRISHQYSFDAFQVIHQPKLDLSQFQPMPKFLIYFGPIPKGLNHYEVTETRGTRMVLSEPMLELLGHEQSRQKLWAALQQLFAS